MAAAVPTESGNPPGRLAVGKLHADSSNARMTTFKICTITRISIFSSCSNEEIHQGIRLLIIVQDAEL
jgi:hypothetical protein